MVQFKLLPSPPVAFGKSLALWAQGWGLLLQLSDLVLVVGNDEN